MRYFPAGCTISFALFTVLAPASFGSTVLITAAAGLSGSDLFPISTVGPDGTTVASPYIGTTNNSNSITFSTGGSNGFSVLQQGNEWSGNFANNALILWTGDINSVTPDALPLTLMFSTAVGGVGFQIQPDTFGVGFTASIDAFDAGNSNIGSYTENGNSTLAGDNSAIFIGVLSTSANVKKVTVNITAPSGLDFAINDVVFGAASQTSSVPEPSSLALFMCGAGIILAIKLKGQGQ